MFTFCNFLAPVLVAAHTVNNLDLSNEQGYENESDYKKAPFQSFLCLVNGYKKKRWPYTATGKLIL